MFDLRLTHAEAPAVSSSSLSGQLLVLHVASLSHGVAVIRRWFRIPRSPHRTCLAGEQRRKRARAAAPLKHEQGALTNAPRHAPVADKRVARKAALAGEENRAKTHKVLQNGQKFPDATCNAPKRFHRC